MNTTYKLKYQNRKNGSCPSQQKEKYICIQIYNINNNTSNI